MSAFGKFEEEPDLVLAIDEISQRGGIAVVEGVSSAVKADLTSGSRST